MKFFVESIDRKNWDTITNGPFIHLCEKDKVFSEKLWSQFTKSESKKVQLDCIAKNFIIPAIDSNEFFRVSKCVSAKDMWNTLESTHEGSSGIVWQHNDMSSFGSSSEVTKTNLCLMAKEESTSSSVSTNSSINDENYYKLLEAFKETHEEAYRLTLLSNHLKSKNNWLEKRVKTLEEELENSKNDFETLELIYKKSSYECAQAFVKTVNLLKIRFIIL